MKNILFLISCLFMANSYSQESVLTNNAVILVYHHVSTTTPPSTSVTPEQFKQHMDYLAEHFHVEKLGVIVDKLQNDEALQPNTVAITFDDGYNNILTNAHPILEELQLPYTVFINPNRINTEKGQLTWAQVQSMEGSMEGSLVTFANHTLDHIHLLDRNEDEDGGVNEGNGEPKDQWLARIWDNINQAQIQLEQKLANAPKWLAYPFGEYNKELAQKLKEEGFVGFAQHSGAISSRSNFSALPRFPAAGIYANLSTLKVKMSSIAIPISNLAPVDPERKSGDSIALSFTLAQTEQSNDIQMGQMRCFYKGNVLSHRVEENTVKIESDIPVPVGRSRVNCTAPSRSVQNRYYWYSQPFFLSDAQGKYLD